MPRFCIVIPCFNNDKTIGEAIASALAQRHDDFVVVVGDNGSKDRSPEIISAFGDPRLIPRLNAETVPKTDNWNRAYRDAPDCEYLVTLHGDDRLSPGALQAIAAQADRGAPPLIHGRFNAMDEDGVVIRAVGLPFDYAASGPEFRRLQMYANVVGVPGVTMRSDLFGKLGGWPPEWTYMQDVEMWSRLSEHGPVRHTRAILGDYRVFTNRHGGVTNAAYISEYGRWMQSRINSYPAGSAEARAGWDSLAAFRQRLDAIPDARRTLAHLDLDDLLGPSRPVSRDPATRQRLYRLSLVARTLLSPARRRGTGRFTSAG